MQDFYNPFIYTACEMVKMDELLKDTKIFAEIWLNQVKIIINSYWLIDNQKKIIKQIT